MRFNLKKDDYIIKKIIKSCLMDLHIEETLIDSLIYC